ncbi:MAG: hypothetical protein VB122_07105, partial [Erysipelotrichales bacterium]|nr:hypothetical protein [Erysipelotrichales bacterium]
YRDIVIPNLSFMSENIFVLNALLTSNSLLSNVNISFINLPASCSTFKTPISPFDISQKSIV